jgi:hypothetical protein
VTLIGEMKPRHRTLVQLAPYVAVFLAFGALFNACCGGRKTFDAVVTEKSVGGYGSGYQITTHIAEHDLTSTFDVSFSDWLTAKKGQKIKVLVDFLDPLEKGVDPPLVTRGRELDPVSFSHLFGWRCHLKDFLLEGR